PSYQARIIRRHGAPTEGRPYLILRRNGFQIVSIMNTKAKQVVIAGVFVLLVVVVVSGGYAHSFFTPDLPRPSFDPVTDSAAAPEFAAGTWINSEPLTLQSLRGRVVLIEFWTFACYNCRNTLPFVKRWQEQYADKGLTIVGVHSPELPEEKNLENVRREVASLGLRYAVVT